MIERICLHFTILFVVKSKGHDLSHCLASGIEDESELLGVLIIFTFLNSSLARYLYIYSRLKIQLEALWKQDHHHAPWPMALLTKFLICLTSLVWQYHCKRHAVAVELCKMSIHTRISWKQLNSERHPLSQVHERKYSIDYYGIKKNMSEGFCQRSCGNTT